MAHEFAGRSNLVKATAELNESIFPVRHECCDYLTDSGGAGRWRGCPGSRSVKSVHVPVSLTTYMVGTRYPMPGIAGGRNGSVNLLTLRHDTPRAEVIPHIANFVPLEAGDRFEYLYGGGGGWGDPLDRDPQLVCDDVLDEYVSRQAAEREYGVVLSGSLEDYELVVEVDATARLRSGRRLAAERS